MGIGGNRREQSEDQSFAKKIGLFQGKVICINPNTEEFKDVLGIELKEESKATEYLGETKDGDNYLRINIWVEDVKDGGKFPVSFMLINKERENKDGTKKQYINNVGVCSWADKESNLPEWFKERDYRVANVGEEELYNFLRTWLSQLDYRNAETTLDLDWRKLMKGNVKDLRDQIDGEWCGDVVCLASVDFREKDGEMKEYQTIYNKAFLSPYSLKQFRLINYDDEMVLENLNRKKPKDLKAHEKFVLTVKGAYGPKGSYKLVDLQDYNAEDFIASGSNVISDEDSSY